MVVVIMGKDDGVDDGDGGDGSSGGDGHGDCGVCAWMCARVYRPCAWGYGFNVIHMRYV